MSRHQLSRVDRVAQMSIQEEIIAKKKLELIEKQKTTELAKQVVAAQTGSNTKSQPKKEKPAIIKPPPVNVILEPPPPKNNFSNDGSFFENFKKITDAAKKAEPPAPVEIEKKDEEGSDKPNDDKLLDDESLLATALELQIDTAVLCAKPPPPPPPPENTETDSQPDKTEKFNSKASNYQKQAQKSIPSLMDTIILPPPELMKNKHPPMHNITENHPIPSQNVKFSSNYDPDQSNSSNFYDIQDRNCSSDGGNGSSDPDRNLSGNGGNFNTNRSNQFQNNQRPPPLQDQDLRFPNNDANNQQSPFGCLTGPNSDIKRDSNQGFGSNKNNFPAQDREPRQNRFSQDQPKHNRFAQDSNENLFTDQQSNRFNANNSPQDQQSRANRFNSNDNNQFSSMTNRRQNNDGPAASNVNRFSMPSDNVSQFSRSESQCFLPDSSPFNQNVGGNIFGPDTPSINQFGDRDDRFPPPSQNQQIASFPPQVPMPAFNSANNSSGNIAFSQQPQNNAFTQDQNRFNVGPIQQIISPNTFGPQQPPPPPPQPQLNAFNAITNNINIGPPNQIGNSAQTLFTVTQPTQQQTFNVTTMGPPQQQTTAVVSFPSAPQITCNQIAVTPTMMPIQSLAGTTVFGPPPSIQLQQQPQQQTILPLIQSQPTPAQFQLQSQNIFNPPPITSPFPNIQSSDQPIFCNTSAVVMQSGPPPPPNQFPPLHTIPPPKPLSLNTIPKPLDLDLNAIPEPKVNLDAIKIPEFSQQGRDNNEFLPTSIDALVDLVAENGDEYEEQLLSRKIDSMHSSLWFLAEKGSLAYRNYRQKVQDCRLAKQQRSNSMTTNLNDEDDDKYDPEDMYDDYKDDDTNVSTTAVASNTLQPNPQQDRGGGGGSSYNPVDHFNANSKSDDYDSDSEYMSEAKERNLNSMKRNIDNKRKYYHSSDSDEMDHMEMYNKLQRRDQDEQPQQNRINLPTNQQQLQNLQRNQLIQNRQLQQQDANNDSQSSTNSRNRNTKKKRSRWGDKIENISQPAASTGPQPLMSLTIPSASPQTTSQISTTFGNQQKPLLTKITRTDPALLQYARQNYGSINLTEDDWKKCEDHYKISLLYQDLLKKRNEIDRLAKSGRFKYEYDSDEDVSGGTWEHKLRNAEMEATSLWAEALNKQSQGKHHIGDFLPPEELKKFMEKYNSQQTGNREPDLSDYKEYKLKEDNIGFQMLQKLGWKEGQGLGNDGSGIINPVNNAQQRENNQGLGAASQTSTEYGDNEYDAYRKRMMLAYRFRPNPLNNPRRAYY